MEVLLVTDEPGVAGNQTWALARGAGVFAAVRAVFLDELNVSLILRDQILLEEADLEQSCPPHEYYLTPGTMRDCFASYLDDWEVDAENVDVSILLTGRHYTNTTGKSVRGGACRRESRHAVVSLFWDDGILLVDSDEFRAVALALHIGRLLGLGACPNETSVMDGIPPLHFASCAATDLAAFLASGASASCLTAPPPDALAWNNYSECGNGVVEPGEGCDSSGPCCAECELVGNATCDPGSLGNEVCCTEACEVANAGVECRGPGAACDSAEECSGESGWCPLDRILDDCKTTVVVIEENSRLDPVVLFVVLGSLAAFIGVLGVAAWRGAKGIGYVGVRDTSTVAAH